MMKFVASLFCVFGCFMAAPTLAAAPAVPPSITTGRLSNSAENFTRDEIIKIGEHFCPAVPEKNVSEKTKKILALVSTACEMEASGLISHDEAQGVYYQALGAIQAALAEIQSSDNISDSASK